MKPNLVYIELNRLIERLKIHYLRRSSTVTYDRVRALRGKAKLLSQKQTKPKLALASKTVDRARATSLASYYQALLKQNEKQKQARKRKKNFQSNM